MAIVIESSKYFHIQWYDNNMKKTIRRSTKLPISEKNRVKAEKIAQKLQEELNAKNKMSKGFRLGHITIGDAFKHLYENYENGHPKTIKDMERFEKEFLKYFSNTDPVISITKLTAEDFLKKVKQLTQKQNSIHCYGKRLRHFLNFLFEYEYIPIFKINRTVMTRAEEVAKIVFNDEHFQRIFTNLYKKKSGFRTSIFLLAYMGLRSSDILEILCENIDLQKRIIKFYSPKGKKRREIGFHKDLVPILAERIAIVKSGKIVPYTNVENLGKAVTRYFEQIGIDGNSYVTRTFRKTFVTYCRNILKIDKSLVEDMVGHEHHSVSDRHYNQISPEIMKDELTKFNLPLLAWMNNSNPNFNEMEELPMT